MTSTSGTAAYVAHMVLRNIDFYARAERSGAAAQHVVYGDALLTTAGDSHH